MSTGFKISFLFLLMIIPQYGNNPLPVMESWLQKDQDDGLVQRDLTSSLTGRDESFGSAHQTYQNSLIRKKKSDNTGNSQAILGYKKFSGKLDQNQAYSQSNVDGRLINNNYNAKLAGNERNDAIFDEFESESDSPSDRYNSKISFVRNQIDGTLNQKVYNRAKSDKYIDIVPSKDVMSLNQMGNTGMAEGNMEGFADNPAKTAKWSLCKRTKDKYSLNQPMNYLQSVPRDSKANFDEISFRDRYSETEKGTERRDLEVKGPYKGGMNIVDESDGKSSQIFNENEYYDAELNPASNEEVVLDGVEDYKQTLNDQAYINKREGTGQEGVPMMEDFKDPSDATKVFLNALKSTNREDAYLGQRNQMEIENEGNTNLKSTMNYNLLRNLNSDLQTKALHDVLKNSQRALKEVQLYQQKLTSAGLKAGNPSGNNGLKRESKWVNHDNADIYDKRLKREDEDEQKNMKTGTDEGGGGEYEDEEGKGHKDEEEYYEDADLSDEETSGNEIRTNENLNQKYVKREITKESGERNSKESQNKNADYEFSVENAPVENSEKAKKASLRRDGEKTKNNSARKGVKIWDQWGKWSPCSVTCGVGRSTRWRHCIGGGCAQGEKEAQIKRCTNPAC